MSHTLTSKFHIKESISSEPVSDSGFIPDNGNLFAKFPEKIGKSAVEVWLFDAVSEDGSNAITISFFRDAVAAPAGFRIAVNATWQDGATWTSPLVFPVSVITSHEEGSDSGGVTGVWQKDESESSAIFEVATDLSSAKVTFHFPGKIVGTLNLTSLGFPSLPKTAKEAEAGPETYWMRPIAMADAAVDITFFSKTEEGETTSRQMIIGKEDRGFGGMDRSWESIGWTKAYSDSVFLRAKVGPYVFQMMLLVGKGTQNHPLTASVKLYHDGKPVCAPRHVVAVDDGVSKGDHTLVVEKLFEGEGLPAVFRHKNVGYQLDFHSNGANGQRWVFDVRHHRAWYRKPLGPPGTTNMGASGFVVSITGGLVGEGELFTGWGYEGQLVLPD